MLKSTTRSRLNFMPLNGHEKKKRTGLRLGEQLHQLAAAGDFVIDDALSELVEQFGATLQKVRLLLSLGRRERAKVIPLPGAIDPEQLDGAAPEAGRTRAVAFEIVAGRAGLAAEKVVDRDIKGFGAQTVSRKARAQFAPEFSHSARI